MNSLHETKTDQKIKTYGQLKLELIQRGLYISPDILKSPDVASGVCPGVPGEEVTLALTENLIVKTFLKPESKSALHLKVLNDKLLLDFGDEKDQEVGIIPLPVFLKSLLKDRTPLSENICLDGYCLNIFLRAVDKGKELNMSKDHIVSIVQSAFEEGSADLVQINMDHCDNKDQGFQLLAPIVDTIKTKFKTFVALKGFPPQEKQTIDQIYAAGFDLLNFPLDGFAGSNAEGDVLPSQQVHEALEYAVGIFSPGTVWTELVLGSEPLDLVKEKIDQLTKKGIVPHLKLLATSMYTGKDYWRVKEVVRHLHEAARRDRLTLKWLYPNCRCVSPLDTQYFTDDPASAKLAAKPVYRSRLGKKAFEGFAALRRKLRIKDVSDSYESAGL